MRRQAGADEERAGVVRAGVSNPADEKDCRSGVGWVDGLQTKGLIPPNC